MTTAHRPTWHNALGGDSQGGTRKAPFSAMRSGKDQPGHLKLKVRQRGQGTTDELKTKNFKNALEGKETGQRSKQSWTEKAKFSLSVLPEVEDNPFPEDADDDPKAFRGGAAQKAAAAAAAAADLSDSDDEDDDDDDEAELLKELERIKKERQEEARKAKELEMKQKEEEDRQRVLRSNPLLMGSGGGDGGSAAGGGGLKRSWDDVVFRNQAKPQTKKAKSFVNDVVRSDFHRKFLAKYIQ